MKVVELDASELNHKELNDRLKECAIDGAEKIHLRNVYGQRYIGTRLHSLKMGKKVEIEIFGTPGNDLGAFLSDHRIIVHGNAQDGVGNTMNEGEIVVEGRAGDVVAMSMRGGKIFIRDGVGYRAAMHMKEDLKKRPVLIIGGSAQDFLGEYMAGGIVILLGLGDTSHRGNYIGTGMHGGVIYIRGDVRDSQLSKDVGAFELDEMDKNILKQYIAEFLSYFDLGVDVMDVLKKNFLKLLPATKRPYGQVYAHRKSA